MHLLKMRMDFSLAKQLDANVKFGGFMAFYAEARDLNAKWLILTSSTGFIFVLCLIKKPKSNTGFIFVQHLLGF